MTPFRLFQPSIISTDCDRCGSRVDLLKGGVCTRCRRILCYTHLHGSWWRRLMADVRNENICTDCRATRHATDAGATDAGATVDANA